MDVTTQADKLRALREAISIETWNGPGPGAPRRSNCTVTLRLRLARSHATIGAGGDDPRVVQAAHVLAAAVFPAAESHQAALPYVDTVTADVVLEATTVVGAQMLRAAVGRMELTSIVARALLAAQPGAEDG